MKRKSGFSKDNTTKAGMEVVAYNQHLRGDNNSVRLPTTLTQLISLENEP